MPYSFEINIYETNANHIIFRFPNNHAFSLSYSEHVPGKIALETLLQHIYQMKESTDYTSNRGEDYLKIEGKANVILGLSIALSSPALSLGYKSKDGNWPQFLNSLLMNALTDKTLTRQDYDKVKPIIKNKLDAEYSELLKQNAVSSLNFSPYPTDDLLKHPLYQLLGMMWNDLNNRQMAYQVKGFFEKFREAEPDKIFESYFTKITELKLIPSSYANFESLFQQTKPTAVIGLIEQPAIASMANKNSALR